MKMIQTDLQMYLMLMISLDKKVQEYFNSKKIKKSIMTKQEIYEQLVALWNEFESNHAATSKVSDTRARKALGEIKKLVTPYRNASVEEAKK
jgi:hypothetical protein